jgi:hypothetical protein
MRSAKTIGTRRKTKRTGGAHVDKEAKERNDNDDNEMPRNRDTRGSVPLLLWMTPLPPTHHVELGNFHLTILTRIIDLKQTNSFGDPKVVGCVRPVKIMRHVTTLWCHHGESSGTRLERNPQQMTTTMLPLLLLLPQLLSLLLGTHKKFGSILLVSSRQPLQTRKENGHMSPRVSIENGTGRCARRKETRRSACLCRLRVCAH